MSSAQVEVQEGDSKDGGQPPAGDKAPDPLAKMKAFEQKLVADGACCAKFPSYFGAYQKQLLGCMKHAHLSEEEKTGLLWFTAADKGCGSFGSAQHCFVAWLSVCVWLQFLTGGVFVMFVILDNMLDAVSDVLPGAYSMDPFVVMVYVAIQLCWCYLWNYVGYWAIETNNGCWSITYLVLEFLWATSLFFSSLASFNYMEISSIFIVTAIFYMITAIAAFQVGVFGAIALSKLHHGGTNAKTARDVHESQP